jgi:hypothetical protein
MHITLIVSSIAAAAVVLLGIVGHLIDKMAEPAQNSLGETKHKQ